MKSMKNILFTITMLGSAQVFAMEAPPAPPAINAGNATEAKPLLPLKGLPADIQRYLFELCMTGDTSEIAQTILAFARTSKAARLYINDNMIAILKSLSPRVKAIDVYKLLQNKKISLPATQQPSLKRWFLNAQERGKELQSILRTGRQDLNRTRELLEIEDIDLNYINPECLNTCLQLASAYCLQEEVRLLLRAGANPNLKPLHGDTALVQAVVGAIVNRPIEGVRIVKMLLAAGANPEDKGARYNAHTNNRTDIIALLDAASAVKKRKLEERRQRYQKESALSCAVS